MTDLWDMAGEHTWKTLNIYLWKVNGKSRVENAHRSDKLHESKICTWLREPAKLNPDEDHVTTSWSLPKIANQWYIHPLLWYIKNTRLHENNVFRCNWRLHSIYYDLRIYAKINNNAVLWNLKYNSWFPVRQGTLLNKSTVTLAGRCMLSSTMGMCGHAHKGLVKYPHCILDRFLIATKFQAPFDRKKLNWLLAGYLLVKSICSRKNATISYMVYSSEPALARPLQFACRRILQCRYHGWSIRQLVNQRWMTCNVISDHTTIEQTEVQAKAMQLTSTT